ncbi:MAG: YjgN family protein, partial [Gammaproteobacteria bacterium]|nr:YjgN family protein [Gammaproteobacteria bacterium]
VLIENPEAKFFPIAMLVLALSMGLMFPWWEYMITNFKVVHAKYGVSDFKFTASIKNYYGMYLKLYGLMILIFGGLGFLVTIMVRTMEQGSGMSGAVVVIIMLFMFPAYLWIFAYIQAKRTNLMYNNLDISGNKVQSELKTGYLLYLYVTNTLAMMLTLGLLMPWAKIRTARYRASVTSLNVAGDLGQYTSAQEQQQSALGEEIGEMFDMDLGF